MVAVTSLIGFPNRSQNFRANNPSDVTVYGALTDPHDAGQALGLSAGRRPYSAGRRIQAEAGPIVYGGARGLWANQTVLFLPPSTP